MATTRTLDHGIKPGSNYAVWASRRLSIDEFRAMEPEQRLRYMVLCAHLAPSSHNTQPWAAKISCEPPTIQVYLDRGEYIVAGDEVHDRRRVLPASDLTGRQACLSVGCFLANLIVAAQYFGLAPAIELNHISPADARPLTKPEDTAASRYVPIATIRLDQTPSEPLNDRALFEAIFTRRVCRQKYDLQLALAPGLYDEIRAIGAEQRVGVHLLSRNRIADRLRMAALAELQFQADNHVANDPAFLRELGAWFLPNDTDAYLGMPGDTFGLQDAQALTFHQGFCGAVDLPAEDRSGLARGSKAGMDSANLVGMLAIAEDTPSHWLNAGMALERIALLLEREGVQLAIHAGLAEVDWVRRSLGTFAGATERPVILFRAGRTEELTPHSPRLPLDHILLQREVV